jgi:hypothetical protein
MRSNPLGELIQVRRTGTVDEYQEQFLTLLARCEHVTEAQQIAVFTAGLQQPLSTDVELQRPATLEEAMGLARAYERRQAALPEAASKLRTAPRSAARPLSTALKSPPPPSATGSTSATPAAPVKPPAPDGRFKRLSPEEMARRRLEGLCFNCPEKFSKEHAKSCTGRGIFYLDLGDEPADDSLAGDDILISTNAITGVRSSSTLQLHTTIQGVAATALVDSGSTHSFIAEPVARRIGLASEPRPGLTVGVANGDRVPCSGVCSGVDMVIGGESFLMDFYIITLDGCDVVLGCEWLRTLGPIVWDFAKLSMTFWLHDHRVHWTGIGGRPSPRLSAAQCMNPLEALLTEFASLFATPTGLPPPRSCDHRIHLLPDTAPVAVPPYRYAQLLKDEIETQCQAMLDQGIIRTSTSPFSAPVLLVRKPDDS